MPFEQDIFISYAHIDNQPLDEGLEGWVETLHERLRIRLEHFTGEPVRIWRDLKLQGNDVFPETLVARVAGVAALVAVLSPRYVKSEWCLRELNEFCKAAEAERGVTVGDKSRIFKVVKLYVPHPEHPPQMRDVLGYEFYEMDERERPREFSPEVSPNKDPKYWARLDDLAWDIKQTLEILKSNVAPPSTKSVYLAEATADVADDRDRLRRELQQRGYAVLPDRELPRRASEFQEAVREHLSRASLSVHLVGASYGMIPEGEEERSVVRLQDELAAERAAADPSFTRLFWMPEGLKPTGNRQPLYVEELQTRLGAGAELLQTSVEDLKMRVLEKLTAPPPKPAPPPGAAPGGGVKSVYLMCDNRDANDLMPIEDYLYTQGFEVISPVFDGDSTEVAQYHRESLVNCDAALIYYGSANQMWMRSKLWDLQKAQGWGRLTPMLTKGVYVTGQPTTEKQRFRSREVPVIIQHFEDFKPDSLNPFIQAIREGGQG